ncbi:MAG: hypothetical protein HC872_07255 [Gammaproteobacteria bacterium]|nr:hypothetical protein [Gammaproteobacteria bacterium]
MVRAVPLMGALTLALATAAAQPQRPFTVADGIAMTTLVDAEGDALGSSSAMPGAFSWSPDGSRVLLVTRRASVVTGTNTFSLLAFSAAELATFVRGGEQLPLPRARQLAAFEISRPRTHQGGIASVRWVGNDVVAFIGRREDGLGQVYRYDLKNGALQQLTRHPEDIVEFDLSLKSAKLLFASYVTPDWTERNRRGYAVTSEPINYLVTKDPDDAFKDLAYYAADLDTGRVQSVSSSAGFPQMPTPIALSPSGRWAVILTRVENVPDHWLQYAVIAQERRKSAVARSQSLDSDWYGGGTQEPWRLQFALVDMEAREVRPLLDAPVTLEPSITRAIWSDDEKSVVFGATMLPLKDASSGELAARARCQRWSRWRSPPAACGA